ncbi:ejaculatory bulb-specific protein 3-like [Schistocerca gregaria]|uniref:ejaculatory bulb-specific protein 3-like n=1 Tax=Schistocerca gregaria TaxID=7010 RepID=UPI00211DB688|nr:ejaculatory bulb-specific protein 3-like [Schistocerca gregaria]
MVRTFVALLVLGALVAAQDKYTTKFDSVNLDDILNNDRLLNKYAQCLLDADDRNCTPDAKELKKAIPDALTNECAKCSEKQKAGTEKVTKFLLEKKPDLWKQLEAKYDPNGEYRKRYDDRIKKLKS